MPTFSVTFLLLFLLGVIMITMRARAKRKSKEVLPGKQIAVFGQELTTTISKQTPLPCLLDEGRKFGEGFREKTPPSLPHTDGCHCELKPVIIRSREMFSSPEPVPQRKKTDLGELTPDSARYYRYRLIARHPDADEKQKAEYAELADGIDISEEFADHVDRHLKNDRRQG